jgi:hypothetical protein
MARPERNGRDGHFVRQKMLAASTFKTIFSFFDYLKPFDHHKTGKKQIIP